METNSQAANSHSRVVVLYGGFWDEREVSLESGQQVIESLRSGGLEVTPVRWDAAGWVILDNESAFDEPGIPQSPIHAMNQLREEGLGVVFVALHGGPGEDGTVQGFLELCGVPYTGGGVHASAICMNKETFRERVRGLGYEVATGGVVHRDEWDSAANEVLTSISVEVGLPVVVKPVASGSSCGVSIAHDTDQLSRVLDGLFQSERTALIEAFVAGREMSIPVLGRRVGLEPEVLPIIEIEPLTDSGFFDYQAKYDPGQAKETVPPTNIEPELEAHLQELALSVHEEFDLGGVSRTDVIVGADGPVVLESQTLPGLTSGSLLPQCAAAAGIDATTLFRRLIDYSLSAYLAKGAESVPGASNE